jgi:hypothetical protein
MDCIDETEGKTPLHEAAFGGNIECMILLLHHKADVNARDNRGRTRTSCYFFIITNIQQQHCITVHTKAM